VSLDSAWIALPLRPELVDARPYGAPQMDLPVCLNVNENPYPPSEAVQRDMVEAVTHCLPTMNRYPDREARSLRSKLASYLGHGLTPEQVWVANGSNEVMIHVLQAFGGPGRRVLTFTPSYSMYPEYARDTHTEYVTVPRAPDFHIDPELAAQAIEEHQPDVVVIATPNNPTGTVTDLDQIEQILQATPGIVLVDEAYQEFSNAPTALSLLPRYPHLAVCRTMSKAFAFAGGRVGYLAASEAFVDALRVVRLPYHLSALTQTVAAVAVDHADEMMAQVGHLRDLRDAAIDAARALGLTVVDSQANFFLFGPFKDRHLAWQRFVDDGVLVRETGPEPYLRVCVGTDEEMDRFHTALADVWAMERSTG